MNINKLSLPASNFKSQLFRLLNPFRFLVVLVITLVSLLICSCEDFFTPELELIRDSKSLYVDWAEYRSAGMGMYSLQQKLVEQIMVLGELRGDLLTVTENATPDLVEVNEFSIRRDNPYASPVNFYKLIVASNRLIHQLSTAYPHVLDKNEPVNNYDRLYGEALCMRAWAYFNAVRIYGKVPLIPESLTLIEDIEDYVNSQTEFVIPEYIIFSPGGYYNDTIRDTTIILERTFLNEKEVIEYFSRQLENDIKAVGVNHSIYNDDETWR